MKITRKAIALLMAAVMVIGGAADLQAQKRKTGAKKRTTTTSTAAVKKVPDLTGNKFLCFIEFVYAGKTMQFESSITLKSDGTSWDFGYLDKEGEWSVTGNTLKSTLLQEMAAKYSPGNSKTEETEQAISVCYIMSPPTQT